VSQFDVFNGDADGICALHLARLDHPLDATLVTGVKRDIKLLARVPAASGDHVLALDISLDSNLEGLEALLARGVRVRYVDHHRADNRPDHPSLDTLIDTAPSINTSLLMHTAVGGRFAGWAVVGAFGDNLDEVALTLGGDEGFSEADLDLLRRLGVVMNYNAYGATPEDLHIKPEALYRRVQPFADPLLFARQDDTFSALEQGYHDDMERARAVAADQVTDRHAVYRFPATKWARRVGGVFANELARAHRARAHALLTSLDDGGYVVSVRAPLDNPTGADELCSSFPTGGGRKGAAGINRLDEVDVARFVDMLAVAYA